MKPLHYLTALIFLISTSACVTTRSQLNEQRAQGGETENAESAAPAVVKSEDLTPKAPSTSVPPMVAAPAAPTQATAVPYALPPVKDNQQPAVISSTPAVTSQYGMEEMRASLAKMSGQIEELEQEKKIKDAAQSEEQKKLQTKVDDLEKKLKEKEALEAGPAIPEGKTSLEAGKDAYFSNRFDLAIQYFDAFLKTTDSGKEAEEATFLRAESNFKQKEYKKAIVDYSKFPEKYPKSNYHPKALLKIAECFEGLAMKEDAKAFYSDLFEKFPKTVEGKLAKKKLTGKSAIK